MEILNWAKKEVELACKRERAGDIPEEEWDYGCACYKGALEAFEVLCNQGHSGFSIGITKSILISLIDGRPLTPIEDTEDVWNLVCTNDAGVHTYQCSRMSSLFKSIYPDGTVEYSDNDRMVCVSIGNPNVMYHSGLVGWVAQKEILPPITMPYTPNGKPYKFYCDDFLTDRKNGDFDTVGIYHYTDPITGKKENVFRFFKEADTETGWEEISIDEFEERRKLAEAREEREAKKNEN